MFDDLDLQIFVPIAPSEAVAVYAESGLLAAYRSFTRKQREDLLATITVIALGLQLRVVPPEA